MVQYFRKSIFVNVVKQSVSETGEPENHTLPLVLSKRNNRISFNPAGINILTFNFSIAENKTTALFITPKSNFSYIKLFITEEDRKPTLQEVWSSGIKFPADGHLYSNFSDFTLSNSTGGSPQWSLFFTYNASNSPNFTGEFSAGIVIDINSTGIRDWLREEDSSCLGNKLDLRCDVTIEISFEIEVRSMECLYWNKSQEAWSKDGCEVRACSKNTASVLKLYCLSLQVSWFPSC